MTKILDHGSIELVDRMGGDLSIVNAARTSFDQRSVRHHSGCPMATGEDDNFCNCTGELLRMNMCRSLGKKDSGLINFLMRERHGTPFEMVQVIVQVECPIFVAREWMRHRIGSFNEMSGRYTKLPDKQYVPTEIREQVGSPGRYRYEAITSPRKIGTTREIIDRSYREAWSTYEDLLADGLAKEQARLVLPVGQYTKFVWSVNLRSALNFLSLRNAPTAQAEIREYAAEFEEMLNDIAPVAMAAFRVNDRIAP